MKRSHHSLLVISLMAFLFWQTLSCSSEIAPPSQSKKSASSEKDDDDSDEDDKKIKKDSGDITNGEEDHDGISSFIESFQGEANPNTLVVKLEWSWMANHPDVAKFEIVRLTDETPADCTSGIEILDSADTTLDSFDDEVDQAGIYTYRLCVFDASTAEFVHITTEEITVLPPCAGKKIGGHCWYANEPNPPSNTLLCSDTCADHGGFDLQATQEYLGHAGTNEQCFDVLEALNIGDKGAEVTQYGGSISAKLGCYLAIGLNKRYRGVHPTEVTVDNTGQESTNLIRVCACKE